MKKVFSAVMAGLILLSMMGVSFNPIRLNVASVQASTTDWWSTFQHDLSRSGFSTSPAPDTANLVWQAPDSEIYYGSETGVITSNGRIIATDWGGPWVIAIDEASGAQLWRHSFSAPSWMMRGTPSTDGNLVYVVTDGGPTTGVAAILHALSFADGHEVWSQNIGPSNNYADSPAISLSHNIVIVGSATDPSKLSSATVWAFDRTTGALVWHFDETPYGSFPSSAAIDDANGRVYIASGYSDGAYTASRLYCLDLATGHHLYDYTFQRAIWDPSTPTICNGRVYYLYGVSGYGGGLHCFDANLNQLWYTPLSFWQYFGAPAVAYGRVFTGQDCVDASNGNILWHIDFMPGGNLKTASPSIADGKMYMENGDGFCCYNANDGKLVWSYPATGDTDGTPAISNGKVYFTCDAHRGLFAFAYVQPFHHVSIYEVEPGKQWLYNTEPAIVPIKIGVKNLGTYVEANINIKICAWETDYGGPQMTEYDFGTLSVTNLQPGESRESSYNWQTSQYRCGNYEFFSAIPDKGDSLTNETANVKVLGQQYFIIVAGKQLNMNPLDFTGMGPDYPSYPESHKTYKQILESTDMAYRQLLKANIAKDHILYLAPEDRDPDGDGNFETDSNHYSSLASFDWAINNWAAALVNAGHPLFLYLDGHGQEEGFYINYEYGGLNPFDPKEILTSTDLASSLQGLKTKNYVWIHFILGACHSGSFMDELGPITNMTICSCRSSENSYFDDNGKLLFDSDFWTAIGEGKSVAAAFNDGYDQATGTKTIGPQTPILDDDGDGQGSTGHMPNGVDGSYASELHIGHCEWALPYMSSVIAGRCYAWPPPSAVTLWCKVENNTNLLNVTCSMVPPDWVNPPNSTILDCPIFAMTDNNHDGNFTVSIPVVNFTQHASGPSLFSFRLDAEQQDGTFSYTKIVDVVFSISGQPIPDITPPTICVFRPVDGVPLHGWIVVNGTAADDVSLQMVELYVDDDLLQTTNLPMASESFFQFNLDTTPLSEGAHALLVKSYDTSGNAANQTLTIYVVNDVHDVAVSNGEPNFVVCQGLTTNVPITVVNHGSFVEDVNVTLFVDSNPVETKTLTNLHVDGYAIADFAWNTSGRSIGNYTLGAYAEPVPGETNLVNNNFTGRWTIVSMVGDLTGGTSNPWDFVPDGKCDGKDISLIAKCFGSYEGCSPPLIYNVNCDLFNRGKIDGKDISLVAKHFGEQT